MLKSTKMSWAALLASKPLVTELIRNHLTNSVLPSKASLSRAEFSSLGGGR